MIGAQIAPRKGVNNELDTYERYGCGDCCDQSNYGVFN